MTTSGKDQALEFLKDFEKIMNNKLLSPDEMKTGIPHKIAAAKADNTQKYLRHSEAAFLNGYAIPVLSDMLQSWGLTKDQARQAFLNEYHRTMQEITSAPCFHWEYHPFRKMLGASPTDIYRDWRSGKVTRSAPDFGLRDPFPHSILFEGKYFSRGSLEYAQRQLVGCIYQAFFYRGLPSLPATKKHKDEWAFDYACLLAYDGSPKGTLTSAWKELDSRTRRSFWQGANVYVMILRGSGV
jgi:hypothetical protein